LHLNISRNGYRKVPESGVVKTRTGVEARPSQRCSIESALARMTSFRYVLAALARMRRRISERASSTM